VTDVTDGFIFAPLAISFSRFQNWAVLKLPDFETGAAEPALITKLHLLKLSLRESESILLRL
jgi:hypothetical protein